MAAGEPPLCRMELHRPHPDELTDFADVHPRDDTAGAQL
jgi:hypothetical protein